VGVLVERRTVLGDECRRHHEFCRQRFPLAARAEWSPWVMSVRSCLPGCQGRTKTRCRDWRSEWRLPRLSASGRISKGRDPGSGRPSPVTLRGMAAGRNPSATWRERTTPEPYPPFPSMVGKIASQPIAASCAHRRPAQAAPAPSGLECLGKARRPTQASAADRCLHVAAPPRDSRTAASRPSRAGHRPRTSAFRFFVAGQSSTAPLSPAPSPPIRGQIETIWQSSIRFTVVIHPHTHRLPGSALGSSALPVHSLSWFVPFFFAFC
jgi:hypothetical protein